MNTKTLGILIAVALVLIGAAFFVTREKPASDAGSTSASPASAGSKDTKLLPDLAKKIDDAAEITILHNGTTSVLKKADGAWVMPEKGGFPVKPDLVRKLLVSLADLGRLEPKTSQPDLYAKLGVEEPATTPAPPPPPPANPMEAPAQTISQATLVTVKDTGGTELAKLVVGNDMWSGTPGSYVRKASDKQSYLARPRVELMREANQWIDTQFANIGRERLRSVSVTNAAKETIALARESTATPSMQFTNLPAGRELKNPGAIETYANTLAWATFEDVAKPEVMSTNMQGAEESTAELRTFDGVIITVRSLTKASDTWWTLAAKPDPEWQPVAPPPAPLSPDDPKAAPAPGSDRTREVVDKEIADLNAKWGPWAYKVPKAKAEALRNTWDDLLKTTAAPAEPATPPPSDSSIMQQPG